MKVEIHAMVNATEEEKTMFKGAANALEEALKDPIFWNKVQAEYDDFLYKEGLSFNEFKRKLLSGADKFNKLDDGDIDVHVTMYYSRKRVVGFTYPSTWRSWANRNIYRNYDISDIAGNILHEYLHNLGYGHPRANRRSLVYQMGYLVRDHIAEVRGIEKKPIKYRRSFWSRVRSFFGRLF